jgi:hypothetical protein
MYEDYIASVVDEWNMNMVHWWNDINRGKSKDSEVNLSQCYFGPHTFHMDCPELGFHSAKPMLSVLAL